MPTVNYILSKVNHITSWRNVTIVSVWGWSIKSTCATVLLHPEGSPYLRQGRARAASSDTYFLSQRPTCSFWWSHSRSDKETRQVNLELRCKPPPPAWPSGFEGTRGETLSSPGAPHPAHPLSCPGYSSSHSGSTGYTPSASLGPAEAQPLGRYFCCLRCSWCSWTGCRCSCWAGRQ